jgi:hypothetical protein
VRPKGGTTTSIQIQNPDTNTAELRWHPHHKGAGNTTHR